VTENAAPTAELAAGLYQIELGFVNAYLVEVGSELVLIDAGFPNDASLISGAIESLGLDLQNLRRIVLTHAHIDHYGAAVDLRNLTGARIMLSELDAKQVSAGLSGHAPMQILPGFEELVAAQLSDPDFLRKTGGRTTETPMTIDPFDVDDLLVAGDPVDGLPGSILIETPGHCAGQLSIILDRDGGWLLAGDAACNFGVPSIAPVAEDLELAAQSFKMLSEYEFQIACFGHGDPVRSDAADSFRSALGA
jgi:glyoxylase-like metal-dependent hydrolase (beta-lactamase superfamily II)